MPLPVLVGVGTVTGTFTNDDGSAAAGKVYFTPGVEYLLDAGDDVVVVLRQHVVTLDATGSFSQVLVATDDTDLNPIDFTWTVRVDLTGKPPYHFAIDVPEGTTRDLADISPVPSSDGSAIVAGPPGPPGTGAANASDAETLTGTITTKWLSPANIRVLDEVYNVERSGVVGNGVANDSTALAHAMTQMPASGGTLFIPERKIVRYDFDIVPVPEMVILGARDGTSVLKPIGTNRGIAITNIPGVTIQDLTIDCDKANTPDRGDTTQHAIMVDATNSTGCPRTRLVRVKILNAWDRGVSAKATAVDTNPLEIEFDHCDISGCGSHAAFVLNSTRTRAQGGDYHASLVGMQVAGGRNAEIDGIDAYLNLDNGWILNTGLRKFVISRVRAWENGDGLPNNWGGVVGINAREFEVADCEFWENSGGLTIDVADTVTNPIDTRGVVHGIVSVDNTLSDGIHVNQADGLELSSFLTAFNAQDGVSIYGRNVAVLGGVTHHNGWDGINFEQDLTAPLASCGPHRCTGVHSYSNNQSAGAFADFYSGALTNGPVVWDIAHAGSPEGVLRGGIGSTYRCTDGGVGTTLYTKRSGTGNTGWVSQPEASLKHKTADQSTSDGVNLTDVTELTFAVEANATYIIEWQLFSIAAAATTGLVLSVNGPASPTYVRFSDLVAVSGTGVNANGFNVYNTALVNSASSATAAVGLPSIVTCYLVNGANAGTVALRVRSEVDTSSVTVQRGSWGRITRVA